ncbi:MAG: 16S rRNA (uracil(1498)-N(3))-methyltransferase, partial [Opitutus sp.]
MNVILFESLEDRIALSREDRRAVHILDVLKRREGDLFDAGVVNGPRGKGTITEIGAETISVAFSWAAEPVPLDPLCLIIGLPRPQTARLLLRELTSLGVAAVHFVVTEKGEPNYGQSSLWHTGEWRRHVIAGVE